MGYSYDYRRSTLLPKTALSLALTISLLLDTIGIVLLYFYEVHFSTNEAYREGTLQYDFHSSVSDVVLLNLGKAAVLCSFYAFAAWKTLAFCVSAVALAFYMSKLALYNAWSDNYLHLSIIFLSLLTAVIELIAVYRTVYTTQDPDTFLAEQVEREVVKAALVAKMKKSKQKKQQQQTNTSTSPSQLQKERRIGKRGRKRILTLDDEEELEAYRLLLVGEENDEEEGRTAAAPGTSNKEKQQQRKRPSMLYLLYRYAQPDHGLLLAGFFFIVISSLFKLAIPSFASTLLTLIIEGATSNPPVNTLKTADFASALFYFILSACGLAFFTCLRIWCTAKAEVRLVARLQRILFYAILKQDIAYMDSQGTGALTSRLTSDCTLLGAIFTTNVNVALQSSINLVGSTAYLFVLDPRLAGAYLTLVLAFMALTRIFGGYAKKMQRQIQTLKAQANGIADQSISLVRLVRAFATEEWEKSRFDERSFANLQAELKVKMLWTIYVPIVFLLQNGLVLVVLLLGGYLVLEQGMTARSLTAFYFYSTTITDAMQSLADNILSILTGLGAGEKIMDIIAQQPSIPVKGGLIPSPRLLASNSSSSSSSSTKNAILAFDDVSLIYPLSSSSSSSSSTTTSTSSLSLPTPPPVIEHMHLNIHQGERIALVGLSGSGKSSLISLLLRYYTPTHGRILFRGHDIQDLDPRWMKGQLGIVTQEPMLMGISLKENIAYGMLDVEEEEVEEVARMAAIHEFICTLPEGYETVVGERGVTLSGGERQRVGIARALLRKPQVLILDEATSALDTQTEASVQDALENLHRARPTLTIITIAHRLSTVVGSDCIYVMAKGKIVESGTHAELLEKEGMYRELVLHQLQEEVIHRKASLN